MGKKHSGVDAYIARSAPFARPILRHLRAVVHRGCPGVEEELKWGHPHFNYKGMFCGIAAFKEHAVFGFWKHALLVKGPHALPKVAEKGMGNFGRLTSLADLPSSAQLVALVRRAAALNDLGIRPSRKPRPRRARRVVAPAYFMAALRRNAKALASYKSFSPSAQREYVEWVTEAKTPETRQRRIETSVAWMAEGKSRNWKYEKR